MNSSLIFEKISFKNIQSYGNKMSTIDFLKSNNVLISGKNGFGKSTICSAIIYVLFGKAYTKIKKDELINRVNQEGLYVEIEFKVNGVPYKVERGMKPSIFKIYKNGDLINQSSTVRDYQIMLERSIIGLSELTFRQTVILGSADYTPFMRMNNSDRRTIIEELLDIKMFSVMNNINKEKLSTIKTDISVKEQEISLVENSIGHIESHTQNSIDSIETLIEENNKEYEKIEKEVDDMEKTVLSLINILDEEANASDNMDLTTNKKKLKKVKDYAIDFSKEIKKNKKTIIFFNENDNCPVCQQSISSEFKETKITEVKDKNKEYGDAITEAKNTAISLQNVNDKLSANIERFKETSDKLQQTTTNAELKKQELIKIQNRNESIQNSIDLSSELEKLKQLKDKYDELDKERNTLRLKLETHSAVIGLLKDDGVKSKIISNYIPVFNSLIQKYMSLLEFDISFTVDSQFNDIIKVGRDIVPYMSNSEGQKKRLDLAMLFAMRDLAVVKNSTNTNLLILDEVMDSSLDEEGLEAFIKIMYSVIENGITIMVISHRAELSDKFKGHITITKEGKFSKLTQT